MIIALARPVIIDKEALQNRDKSEILALFDISLSMLSKDSYPDRLESGKQALRDINLKLKNADIGVVAFARDAFIISPITYDKDNLDFLISNISTDLTIEGGSDIVNALDKGLKFVNGVKDILIITDGGDYDKSSEILDIANQNSLKIHTITLGSSEGIALEIDGKIAKDRTGNSVITKANPWLEKVADKTGGVYFSGDIDKFISHLTKTDLKETNLSTNDKTELFYYPLALAVLLLFISFNSIPKFNKNAFMMLFMVSFILELRAFDLFTIQKANALSQNSEYKKAAFEFSKIDRVEAKYNQANMLYKDKDYKKAIALYEEILTKDIEFAPFVLHNLGNAYVKNKELEKARDSFKRALALKEDEDTRANLEYVEYLISELKDIDNKFDKLKEGSQMQLENKKEGDLDGDPSKNKGVKKQEESKDRDKDEKVKQDQLESDKKKLLRELSRTAISPIPVPLDKNDKKADNENYW